ncbi:MAG: glycosyltransferase [Candidatus Gastranaerophilales bacterium]|nr:glycosyltransferase [Candidatus Gastranaerophilales bacterium]
MEKVLIVVSDNNKGKFITKGFSDAFKELSCFVIEKKIYDLTLEETIKISPDIIFIFWTDLTQKFIAEEFLKDYKSEKTIFIHCSELLSDIPKFFLSSKRHFIFTGDSKNNKTKFHFSVNPKEYKTRFEGYKYNVTFAGNPSYKNREKLLSRLICNFGSVSVFCRSFDFYKSVDDIYKNNLLDSYFLELYRNSYNGYVNSPSELAKIYSVSKINIDIDNETSKPINYRCLEITASGGFLIAPYKPNIIKYFDDGYEIETYKSSDDLVDKIRFYLNNLNLAQLIAEKGKKNTVSNHSFYDWLKVVLRRVYDKDTCSG